jgi:hypothetical protein
MPILPRRRLQSMLDELGPRLTKPQASHLRSRLDHRDPDSAIPAEYELLVGWSLSKIANLTVEPKYGRRTPDFESSNLFADRPAVIEVVTLSDEGLSDESLMARTANIINQFADRVRRKASKNLHYTFHEISGYRRVRMRVPIGPFTHKSQFWRQRLASKNFELTHQHKAQMRAWLANWPPATPLILTGNDTGVSVSWKDWVHPRSKTFSSMPSSAYDLHDNPLYERLRDKEEQLADVPASHLKCIFLGDGGSRLLLRPNEKSQQTVSGREIIWDFLHNSTVDMVCILSPRRRNENIISPHNNSRQWFVEVFDRQERPEGYYRRLNDMALLLPRPHLHGYQARSWMQQNLLSPQGRGQYLPLSYSGGQGRMTIRVSARGLLELLAGRMKPSEIETWITRGDNPFERQLALGRAISNIALESNGDDDDDDYVVITLADDPNASPLGLPSELLEEHD